MNGSGQVRSPANRAAFIEELATIMSEVTDQELTPLVRKIEVELTAVRERARAVMAERDALREQTARQREAVRQYFCECRYGDGITLGIALTRMLNAAGLDPVWPDEIPEHDRNALQIVVEHRRMEEENARLRRELDRAQAASEALARTLHEERTAAAALRERVLLCAKEWVQMAIEDAPTPGHGEALRHCAIAVEAALANAQPGELEALRDGATDLRKWLDSDDTGLSSTAMARHLASHAGLGVRPVQVEKHEVLPARSRRFRSLLPAAGGRAGAPTASACDGGAEPGMDRVDQRLGRAGSAASRGGHGRNCAPARRAHQGAYRFDR